MSKASLAMDAIESADNMVKALSYEDISEMLFELANDEAFYGVIIQVGFRGWGAADTYGEKIYIYKGQSISGLDTERVADEMNIDDLDLSDDGFLYLREEHVMSSWVPYIEDNNKKGRRTYTRIDISNILTLEEALAAIRENEPEESMVSWQSEIAEECYHLSKQLGCTLSELRDRLSLVESAADEAEELMLHKSFKHKDRPKGGMRRSVNDYILMMTRDGITIRHVEEKMYDEVVE